MEHGFWLARWQQNQIGFHLPEVNPRLVEHGSALPHAPGQRVLVPLCGKSVDMVWLAQRGLRVLGVELSALAIDTFFEEQQWMPRITREGAFTRYATDQVEILCGDVFALEPDQVGELHGVYDRAAMVALPPSMRGAYAQQLSRLLPRSATGLLVTFAYDPTEMTGPPFAVPETEVRALLSPAFDVTQLADHDILQSEARLRDRGLTQLHEQVYALLRS